MAPFSWLTYADVMEARRRLDFSEWDRPQGQYVDEFAEVYHEHNMPAINYLLLHPSARLSIQEWNQLFDGLEQIRASYRH